VVDSALAGTIELVVLAQRGDGDAFARLYGEFARVVHGIALAHCGKALADDVTQDVFMAVFQRLPELRTPEAFPAFLCTAARNASIDALRRQRRTPTAAELPDVAAAGRPVGEPMAQREQAEQVLACVQALPEAYRETLVLRLCEGLPGPEIAARTGLTHGSVRVNLARGMAMLRARLQEAGLP
jgi:RNA polymerase sigma-70 factor (ECF subfamily)